MNVKLIAQWVNKVPTFNFITRTIYKKYSNGLKLQNVSIRTISHRYLHTTSISFNDLKEPAKNTDEIDIEAITKGDEALKKKLQIIILEIDSLRQDAAHVPDHIKTREWIELLNLTSRSQKIKYLRFLFKNEKANQNFLAKKAQRKLEREKLKEEMLKSDDMNYGLNANTIFFRIYEKTINNQANNRLIQAMNFNQKLVIDCSYDEYMSKLEAKNCAEQFKYLFSSNRNHIEPFDIYFCNVNPAGITFTNFQKLFPCIINDDFPINISEKSYLEHFPREKLVYLTPHCREELLKWDHDAVYIIGGIVDKSQNGPISLGKAKENGIKMAKLPLDRHLKWGSGSGKALPLNQIVNILLTIRSTGDWNEALKYVPSRKIFRQDDQVNVQKKYKKRTYF